VVPRLIHPVPVEILPVDRAATLWDADFNEPVNGGPVQYGGAFLVAGQIRYDKLAQQEMVADGESPVSSGHIVIKASDAAKIKKSDKIVRVGGIAVELYVTEIRPGGTYGGNAHLAFVRFSSRRKG